MARVQYFGKTTASTSVTVYWAGTTTKPTIYGSATGSSISNPLTSSFEGDYSFWVDEGHYKILNGKLVNGVATNIDDAYILSTQGAEPTASKSSLAPFQTNTATNVESWVEGAYTGSTYVAASALKSATTVVGVAAATAPSNGQVLTATSSTTATWQTPSTVTVPGADTNLVYNDGGALGADANLTWNKTTKVHALTGGYYSNTQAVAATSTDGVVLATSSTATSGNQKWSPAIHHKASCWVAGSVNAAQSLDAYTELVPVQGGVVPMGRLSWKMARNGGTAQEFMSLAYQLDASPQSTYDKYSFLNVGSMTDSVQPALQMLYSGVTRAYLSLYGTGGTSDFAVTWSNNSSNITTTDTYLTRGGAANLQLGSTAANPPVAQTLSVQDASGTDIAGATWTFRGSRGTGTGTPGSIAFQTSTALGTGTTLQTATTRLTISSTAITSTLPIITPGYTVANLPAGVTGMRAHVTDANATTFLSTVAGGGANTVPVFYDGTNWVIG